MATQGHSPFQRCACSGLGLVRALVTSEEYLLWHGLPLGQSALQSESPHAWSVFLCEYVSIHVLSVFSMCFPKSSSAVSLHAFLPQEYLLMYPPAPLASSCHSFLNMFKQRHCAHFWLKFWHAMDHLHQFQCRLEPVLTSTGQLATSCRMSPLQPPATETLQFMANTVVHSKPRYADAASVRLLIFANGVVLFKIQEVISCLWGGGKQSIYVLKKK